MTDLLRGRPSIPEVTRQIDPLSRITDVSDIRAALARTAERQFAPLTRELGIPPEQVLPELIAKHQEQSLAPFKESLDRALGVMILRGSLLPRLPAEQLDNQFIREERSESRVFRSLFRPENRDLRARIRNLIDDTFEDQSDRIKQQIAAENAQRRTPRYDIVIIGDGPISSQIAEAIGYAYEKVLIISKEDQVGGIWDRHLSVNNSVEVVNPKGACWPFQEGSTGPIGIQGLSTIGLESALEDSDTYTVLCDDGQTKKTYIKGPQFRDVLKFRAALHGVPVMLNTTVDVRQIQLGTDLTSLIELQDSLGNRKLQISASAVFIATGGGEETCKLTDEQSQKDYDRAASSVFNQIKGIQRRNRAAVTQLKQLTNVESTSIVRNIVERVRLRKKLILDEVAKAQGSTIPKKPEEAIRIEREIESILTLNRSDLDNTGILKLRRQIEAIVDRMDLESITLPSILSRTMIDASISCWKRYMNSDPARFPLNQIRLGTKSIGLGGRGDTVLTTLALLLGTDDVPEEAKPQGVPQLDPEQIVICSEKLTDTPEELRQALRPRYREVLSRSTIFRTIKRNVQSCVNAFLGEDTPEETGVLVRLNGEATPRFFSYFIQSLGITRADYEQALNLEPIEATTTQDGNFPVALGDEINQQYLVGTASGIKQFPRRLSQALNILNIGENTQALWVWAGTLNPRFILPWFRDQLSSGSVDVEYIKFKLNKDRINQQDPAVLPPRRLNN